VQWLDACRWLEDAKTMELALRKELVSYVLDSNKLENYSVTMKLGNGYGLKATQVLNYKTDENSAVEECLEKLYICGFINEDAKIFNWKASLNKSTYKKLSKDAKSIVDEVLSMKIGTPQLEFIKPSEKKK